MRSIVAASRLGPFAWAALILVIAARPASGQPPNGPEIAGIWHARPAVGAGYCERWVLAPDGRFEARAAQSGCARIARRVGRWVLSGSTLLVTETSRTVWLGGRCVRDEVEARLDGARARLRAHARPRVLRLVLRPCSSAERDESPAECLRFGTTPRWRLATDEPVDAP